LRDRESIGIYSIISEKRRRQFSHGRDIPGTSAEICKDLLVEPARGIDVTRREWLTLFVALEGAPDGLDPVRIQKGMFLFAMESNVPTRDRYEFKPYDYGPMSAAIYQDLDLLVERGLIERVPVPGKNWSRFRATSRGHEAGQEALAKAEAERRLDAARRLYDIKQRVAGLPFNALLASVYHDYPEYAVKSVFVGAG
jgi:uncharacterized protein